MSFSELLPHLAASLVYLHTFLYKAASEINFAAWSLEVEIQFYIAAPLLCRVFSIRSVRLRRGFLILAMMAAATGQQFWLAHQPAWLRLTLLDSISYFLVGFLLVDFFIVDWKKQPSRSFRWDLISGAAWLALVPLHYFHVADPYLLPAVCAVAYTGAFRGRLLGVGLQLPWIVTLGGMCYTIYLYHYQVISVLGRVLLSWGWTHAYWSYLLWQVTLFASPLFLCAALLFVWFEKPFMAKRWWKPS
jgi:peptidoglycan/LPS O-acetylase OafA/YrhL